MIRSDLKKYVCKRCRRSTKSHRKLCRVVYRGDDSVGDHIVNYVLVVNGQEDFAGICLVKIADSTVQIKELDKSPNDNSR